MPSTKIINILKDDKFEDVLDIFKNTQAKEVIFVLPKKTNAFKDEEHFIILSNEAKKMEKTVSLLCSSPEINALGKQYDFDVLMPKSSSTSASKSLNKPITLVNQIEPDEQKDEDNDMLEKEEYDMEEKEKDEDADADGDDDENIEEELDNDDADNDDNEKKKKDDNEETDDLDFEPIESHTNHTSDDFDIITASAPVKTNRSLHEIIKSEDEDKINVKVIQRRERAKDIGINKYPEEKANQIKSVWQFNDNYSEDSKNHDDSLWKRIHSSSKRFLKFKTSSSKDRGKLTKSIVLVSSGVLILLFGIVFFTTGNVKIDIRPQKPKINFQLKVSTSDKYSSVDTTFYKIPGQLFNIEKNVTQTFQATGQREVAQKAKGIITVYNEYGTTPQTLIATTRFESSEGLIFRTLKTIIVPGTKVENGKIIPGSINVEIIADKPGPTYNITASRFTIPAFKEKGDLDRYSKFYGQSTEPTKGGISGMAKIVTESDYNNAIGTLTALVKDAIAEAIKAQTPGLKIINSTAVTIKTPESDARIDEATDSFTMTVGGSIKTLGFKQDDLNTVIKQYAEKNNNDVTILPDKLDIIFDKIAFVDNSNKLDFTVIASGTAYAKINAQKILSEIAGNNKTQIRDYLKNIKEINSAKVAFYPFWINKIPKNKEDIHLNIIYD